MRGNAAVTNSGLNKNTKSGNQNNAGNAEQAVDETVEEPTERKEDKAQGSGTQEPPLQIQDQNKMRLCYSIKFQ